MARVDGDPNPKTVTALLPCEGPCNRATQHWYAGSARRDAAALPEWTLGFRCSECGHMRVWGATDQRPSNADQAVA